MMIFIRGCAVYVQRNRVRFVCSVSILPTLADFRFKQSNSKHKKEF